MAKKSGGLANARAKALQGTAWVSFGAAVIGGGALSATIVGRWIGNVVGWLPIVVSVAMMAFMIFGLLIDILKDSTPNQPAVMVAILAPSMANGAPGKMTGKVGDWSHQAFQAANPTAHEWLGSGSAAVVAAGCIAIAIVSAQKVMKGSH